MCSNYTKMAAEKMLAVLEQQYMLVNQEIKGTLIGSLKGP